MADDETDTESTAAAASEGDATAIASNAGLTETIDTAAASLGGEPESAHAWSLDEHGDEPGIESKWRGRLLWAGLVVLLCAAVAAVVWFSAVYYFGGRSTPKAVLPPTSTSSTAAPPVVATATTATPPVTTATLTTTKPTLPVAIVGSSCRPDSTPTHDPDGTTVYCAIVPEVPLTAVWSRVPGPLPYPTIVDQRVTKADGPWWVVVCEQQTGRSFNYCNTAIKQATYQGDGPIPES